MAHFRDADGETWPIVLLRPQFRAIKDELGIDLMDLGDEQTLTRLLADPLLIVDLVSVALTPEIRRRHTESDSPLTAEEWFARRMHGDALERAADALLEALVDFFPGRRREILRKALATARALLDWQLTQANRYLESEQIQQALGTPGKTSTASVDTSAPTPIE